MSQAESLFFTLLRSGLWGTAPDVSSFQPSEEDWKAVLRNAREQTVIGLVAEGAALCPPGFVPEAVGLRLLGLCENIRRLNARANSEIASLVPLFEEDGIPLFLLKGQGIACCYLKPELRMPGDIDLFVLPEDYRKSKETLSRLGVSDEGEGLDKLHYGAMHGDMEIEIHGTVHTSLGKRINGCLDEMQRELFSGSDCRIMECRGREGSVEVRLPGRDFDALFIFIHLLQHFFCGGLGLRQLCDWARLLHCCRGSLDVPKLEARLEKMGLKSEWKAFMSFIVNYLALPEEDAVLLSPGKGTKARRIWKYVGMVGNFGTKLRRRDRTRDPYLFRKIQSFFINSKCFLAHIAIFPLDSLKFFWGYFVTGMKAVIQGQ